MADHVEVLTTLRDFYAGSVLDHKEKADALTAAISAMTVDEAAVERALIAFYGTWWHGMIPSLQASTKYYMHAALQAAIQGASHD